MLDQHVLEPRSGADERDALFARGMHNVFGCARVAVRTSRADDNAIAEYADLVRVRDVYRGIWDT